MAPERNINPAMVILGRESRGLTQSDLAPRLGVSQGRLSKIEAGLVPAPDELLPVLAKELRFPETFFCEGDRAHGPGVSELFHRKRAAASMKTLRTIYARLNLARMHVDRLLQSTELPDITIPQHDPDEFPNVADIARAVRAEWRLPAGPIPDVIEAIEDAGAIVIRFPFETKLVDAISWWVPGSPPLIFVNRDLPPDRERWSVCHELGHCVMHRSARPEMEDEANRFASEFLMPEDEIGLDLDGVATLDRLAALKPHWRVSMAALLYRAKQLNGISDSRYRYLWMKMGPYRQREPAGADIAPDKPGTLQELFEYHSKELGYSVDQVAELLRADIEDLRAWYHFGESSERSFRVVK